MGYGHFKDQKQNVIYDDKSKWSLQYLKQEQHYSNDSDSVARWIETNMLIRGK